MPRRAAIGSPLRLSPILGAMGTGGSRLWSIWMSPIGATPSPCDSSTSGRGDLRMIVPRFRSYDVRELESVAPLFREERCGIYILEFSNGDRDRKSTV